MKIKKIVMALIVTSLATTMIFAGGSKDKEMPKEEAKTEVATMSETELQPCTTPSGDLEIFSWWAGDEWPALEALIKVFEKKYPDVNLENATVTGGSGVNAKAVLKTRMLGGEPRKHFKLMLDKN